MEPAKHIASAAILATFLVGYAHADHCIYNDIIVNIFLITILPPLVFLFLCGIGSTFASIGWFWYWKTTRSRRANPVQTVVSHSTGSGVVEMQPPTAGGNIPGYFPPP